MKCTQVALLNFASRKKSSCRAGMELARDVFPHLPAYTGLDTVAIGRAWPTPNNQSLRFVMTPFFHAMKLIHGVAEHEKSAIAGVLN